MRPAFRAGTWRQALLTFAGVLPVSLFLNVALAPLSDHWPRPAVLTVNAAVLVAALNWALLPALHWATRGWATRRTRTGPMPRRHRQDEADSERDPR